MENDMPIGVALALALFCLLCGAFIGSGLASSSWRCEAVERGFAEYDTKTAEWAWKDLEDLTGP